MTAHERDLEFFADDANFCPDCRREWARCLCDVGHDPDLDENGVCRICGKFEPE